MNTFLLTLIVSISLALFSGCSSKSAKDGAAVPEQDDAAFSDMVFEEDANDEFFDDSFDDEAPAAALGEVLDYEDAPPPATDTGVAAGDDFGADWGDTSTETPAAGGDVAGDEFSDDFDAGGFDDDFSAEGEGENWDDFAAVDPATPAPAESGDLFGGSDPFAFEEAPGSTSGATTDDLGDSSIAPMDDPLLAGSEPVPAEQNDFLADELFQSSPAQDVASSEDFEEDPNARMNLVPVQKIKEVPFRRAGQLLNAVYIVRPGDTPASVSQKVLGANRVDEIMAANPHLNRSFKAGDKVYYNSPQRPNDEGQVLSYYADEGLAPEVYVSRSGDNIREVSSDLLGFEGAWKEVWATNRDVESKWALDSGVELRYWKTEGTGGGSSTLAQNNFEPQQEVVSTPPSMPEPEIASAPEPFNDPLAEEPTDMAANETPTEFPEPEMDDFNDAPTMEENDFRPGQNLADNSLPPPPPPPPPSFNQASMPPPPPPPPSAGGGFKEVANVEEAGTQEGVMGMLEGMDQDMMMLLGVLGVVVLGGGTLMMIRRKRNRQFEIDQALGDSTQVG